MDPNDWMGLYVTVCVCRVSVDRNKCVFKGSSTLRHWRQLSWNNYLFIYLLSGCRSQAAEGHLEIISEQSSSVPPLPLSDRASSVHSPHRPGAHRWTSSCDCPLMCQLSERSPYCHFFPLRSFQTQMCSEESKNVLSCYLVFCAPVRQSFHFIRQPSIGHHVQSDILVLKCTWHVLHKRWWITMSVFYVDNAIPVKTLHFYKGHMLTDQFKGESCWSVAAFPWGEALNKFK